MQLGWTPQVGGGSRNTCNILETNYLFLKYDTLFLRERCALPSDTCKGTGILESTDYQEKSVLFHIYFFNTDISVTM